MSNASDRAKGAMEELGGKVKKNVGDAIDNEQMQAEGHATEMKGQARQESAKAEERGKGAMEELGGKIKKNIGDATNNEQMQAEGRADELKGDARQRTNQ